MIKASKPRKLKWKPMQLGLHASKAKIKSDSFRQLREALTILLWCNPPDTERHLGHAYFWVTHFSEKGKVEKKKSKLHWPEKYCWKLKSKW